jgi:hypothetical protein
MVGIDASVSIHARDVKSRHDAGVRETEIHVYPFKLARKAVAGFVVGARRWPSSGSSTSAGSRDYCSPRAYPITSPEF